jgi:hypothetical protein
MSCKKLTEELHESQIRYRERKMKENRQMHDFDTRLWEVLAVPEWSQR